MILHKYLSPAGIDILQNLRILVQNPNNFNDPFELSVAVTDIAPRDLSTALKGWYGDELYENFQDRLKGMSLEQFKDKVSIGKLQEICKTLPDRLHKENFEFRKKYGTEEMGIVCFSSENVRHDREILLWSHYTSSHAGLRIHFDSKKINVKSKSLCKVEYRKQRISMDPLLFKKNPVASEKVFSKALTRKSIVWKYEKEYRWLINYRECFWEYDSAGTKRYFIEVIPQAVVCVDLGNNMSQPLRDAVKSCLKLPMFAHVVLREAELDRKDYALNYQIFREHVV